MSNSWGSMHLMLHTSMVHWAHVKNTPFVFGWWRAVFRRTSLPWRVERIRSVNYLHPVVCRLNRCIWYAPCRMLLRNFPRGHFHTGGGGTVSNSLWICVLCMLSNVYLWSSEYKNVTYKSSIIVTIYPVVIIHVDWTDLSRFKVTHSCTIIDLKQRR